jgi:Phosphoribosyl transferase domain
VVHGVQQFRIAFARAVGDVHALAFLSDHTFPSLATSLPKIFLAFPLSVLGEPHRVLEFEGIANEAELTRREGLYCAGHRSPDVHGRTVILVHDGLAAGATMQAAIEALRKLELVRIVVAVPLASRDACDEMRLLASMDLISIACMPP